MKNLTYILVNNFVPGNQVISRHRTIDNAVKANLKLQKQVKKNNGKDSYLPTVILHSDFTPISDEEYNDALCLILS